MAAITLLPNYIFAQAVFVTKGKIEFEKKVNMHKYIDDNSWTREFKDRMPVYQTTYFDMVFDSGITVYKAGKEIPDDKWKNMWSESSDEDVIKMDYAGGVYTEFKQVFEKKYLVQDSMLKIDWRITDEYRTIAGFDCRKAVGRFFDSLYVVAFYTDQIPLTGGPEQYNGLPGVILGLAFPRYFTTWFATKVELVTPKPEDLKLPSSKATKINRKELMDQVVKVFEWGSEEERQKGFWNVIL
jgi:GLPGLI family protein